MLAGDVPLGADAHEIRRMDMKIRRTDTSVDPRHTDRSSVGATFNQKTHEHRLAGTASAECIHNTMRVGQLIGTRAQLTITAELLMRVR